MGDISRPDPSDLTLVRSVGVVGSGILGNLQRPAYRLRVEASAHQKHADALLSRAILGERPSAKVPGERGSRPLLFAQRSFEQPAGVGLGRSTYAGGLE